VKIGSGKLIHGNTLDILRRMNSNSVDLIVTSPPYYALRKYPDEANVEWNDGTHCQLGLEPTPELYVEHLGLILKELYRVLRPTGIFFLNIGDSYSGSMGKRAGWSYISNLGNKKDGTAIHHRASYDLPRKCLLCIPERVLFKCLEIGFILRNKIIWYKSSHLPGSQKDRFTTSWEYIYMFVKKPKDYYFNLDAVREKYNEVTIERIKKFIKNQEHFDPQKHKHGDFGGQQPFEILENVVKSAIGGSGRFWSWQRKVGRKLDLLENPTGFTRKRHSGYFSENGELLIDLRGKTPSDLWVITSEPLKEYHFAHFPKKLVARCLACGCPPDGVVLDPFIGSGTTGLVAELFNTKQFDKIPKIDEVTNIDVVKEIDWNIGWIGIDIVSEYIEMTKRRILGEVYSHSRKLTELT